MNPTLSLVIASHRPHYISECVEALLQCRRDAIPTQIIVVADYPIEALALRYPSVHWMFDRRRGIPHKRNTGIAAARGDIVGFTDDDCRPSPEWIVSAVTHFQERPELAGVEGRTIIDSTKTVGAWREARRLQRSGFRTNNIFYRRQALVEAQCFDERFAFQREDVDLAFSMIGQGKTIGYCENCVVMHALRRNEPWDLLKNCWNRRFDPLLYKKHPGEYRTRIGSPTPSSIVVLFMLHVLAISSMFVDSSRFFVPCAGADLCLIAILALRRSGIGRHTMVQFWYETISFAVAPVVLLCALVIGSVRFRKILLV